MTVRTSRSARSRVVDDAILLVRRGRGPARGSGRCPADGSSAGETLHEAVVRETSEETGLEVVVDRFLGWVERFGATRTTS